MVKYCKVDLNENKTLDFEFSDDLEYLINNNFTNNSTIYSVYGSEIYSDESLSYDTEDDIYLLSIFIAVNSEDNRMIINNKYIDKDVEYLSTMFSQIYKKESSYYINFETEEIIDLSNYCTTDNDEAYDNSIAILESLDMDYYDDLRGNIYSHLYCRFFR